MLNAENGRLHLSDNPDSDDADVRVGMRSLSFLFLSFIPLKDVLNLAKTSSMWS